jgi:hypothetical protein
MNPYFIRLNTIMSEFILLAADRACGMKTGLEVMAVFAAAPVVKSVVGGSCNGGDGGVAAAAAAVVAQNTQQVVGVTGVHCQLLTE